MSNYSIKPKPKAWNCNKASVLSDEPVSVLRFVWFGTGRATVKSSPSLSLWLTKQNYTWLTLPFRFLIPANFSAGNICVSCSQRFVWDVWNSRRWQPWGFSAHSGYTSTTEQRLSVLRQYIFSNYFRARRLKTVRLRMFGGFGRAEICKNSFLTHFKHGENSDHTPQKNTQKIRSCRL